MSLPVWVVSLSLVFWGWQAGTLVWAAPLAALLLLPRWLHHRSPLTEAEFHRVLDVCWVLGFGGLLLIYSRESVGDIVRTCLGWLPVVAFPALLAQVWSTRGRVPASALIPFPRWRRRTGEANPDLDLTAVFLLVCLLSASVAAPIRPSFYPGLAAIVGLAFWIRPARTASAPVLAALTVGLWTGGWFLSQGLAQIQPWLEGQLMEWTAGWQRAGSPGSESRTAIGRKGRVGGSGRVVLKARGDGARPVPRLLRTAAFSVWQQGSWYASRADAEKIEGSVDEWPLDPRPGRAGAIDVEWVVGRTEGLVPLPAHTRVLRDLPADSLDRTGQGTVRAEVRGGVVTYRAEYAARDSWERAPQEEDRFGVPPEEVAALRAVVDALDLAGQSAPEAMRRLEAFFSREFQYTLDLDESASTDPRATTPLGRFLLGHRRGHCEYFATAAVLLLRLAGVPARYVAGFAIDPAERMGGTVTVRESHAHAWVRIWDDGEWRDFDPTPAADFAADPPALGPFRRFHRAWHEVRYALARWWWLGEKRWLRQAYWLAVPLLAALAWRFRQLRVAAGDPRGLRSPPPGSAWPGFDSEWFTVESALTARGLAREDLESPAGWTRRLTSAGWRTPDIDGLVGAFRLHERLRFDPRGLPPDARAALRTTAGEWSRRLARNDRALASEEW